MPLSLEADFLELAKPQDDFSASQRHACNLMKDPVPEPLSWPFQEECVKLCDITFLVLADKI